MHEGGGISWVVVGERRGLCVGEGPEESVIGMGEEGWRSELQEGVDVLGKGG